MGNTSHLIYGILTHFMSGSFYLFLLSGSSTAGVHWRKEAWG